MFLKQILRMVAETSLQGATCRGSEVQRGETVLGVLSDDLKKLYVVLLKSDQELSDLHDGLFKELDNEDTSEERRRAIKLEHCMGHLKNDFIRRVFGYSLHMEFPTTNEDLSIREDWQVVLTPPQLRVPSGLSMILNGVLIEFGR